MPDQKKDEKGSPLLGCVVVLSLLGAILFAILAICSKDAEQSKSFLILGGVNAVLFMITAAQAKTKQ